MNLKGKKILIVSPQAWDKVRVSKHHYAIALAQRGNTVFFLNPPSTLSREVELSGTDIPGLTVVSHRTFFPVSIRFKFAWIYRRLMDIHIRRLIGHIGCMDVVWCFDPNLYSDLKKFNASVRIFHPVDLFKHLNAKVVASTSDVIFSVSPTILDEFKSLGKPCYFINHGLGKDFVLMAQKNESNAVQTGGREIGYVGNLLIPYLDRELLKYIICSSPDIRFHLIGPYANGQSTLGDGSSEAEDFVRFLKSCSNVVLYGPMGTTELCSKLAAMDGFLVCYSGKHSGYDLSNSHKILEYLSTGRAVITTPILAYLDKKDLVTMPVGISTEDYPLFFINSIKNLSSLNSPTLQARRKQFALSNSYENQIIKIEFILKQLGLV